MDELFLVTDTEQTQIKQTSKFNLRFSFQTESSSNKMKIA